MKSWKLPGELKLGEKCRGDVYLKQPHLVVPNVHVHLELSCVVGDCTSCPGLFFFFFKMICSSWLDPARIVLPFPPCLGEKMPMAQTAPWSQLCSRCGDFIIHHLRHDSGLSHQLLWFNLKKFKYSGLSGIGFWAGEGKEESERKLLWSALPSDVCPRNRRCCVRALTCHPKGPPQSLCALLCVRVLKVHLPNSDYLTN